jgi:hypothetical protein
MIIHIDLDGLRRTRWYEYIVRFGFRWVDHRGGGLDHPSLGACHRWPFPCFSGDLSSRATLVEKHETQKKKRAGLQGVIRGREAAALDAAGAALGCIGLAGFALVVWQLLVPYGPWMVLAGASLLWLGVSGICWRILKVF